MNKIDAAMLGSDFNGDKSAIRRFAEILSDAGYPTVAETGTHNGGQITDEIPEEVWNNSLDKLDNELKCF